MGSESAAIESSAPQPTATAPTAHLCIVTRGCHKFDGQSRVNYEIAKAAVNSGWRVTFIGSELSPDLQQEPQVIWRKIPSYKSPKLIDNLLFAMQASYLITRHRREFDIVHANGFNTFTKSTINSVHFVHSGWLKSRYYPFRRLNSLYALYQWAFTSINAQLERYAFRASHSVIAVSDVIRQEIKATGVADAKISVIHNGVDVVEFHPGTRERSKFALPEAPFLFLFAGDLRGPRKNVQSVLEALALDPQLHLAVAGNLDRSPYPSLAKSLGVADRVYFLGMTRQMPDLMRSVDAFVFPSRYEPCGLVILEALGTGLPVITAKTAGGAELLGDAGIVLADPDDVPALAAAMARLANDAAERSRMAQSAKATAPQLSWDHMTARYMQAYRALLPTTKKATAF